MPTLILNAGQSNALGFTLTAADLPPSLSGWSDSHAQIWNPSTGAFQTMVAGTNTGTSGNPQVWGPQVQFAYEWVQNHPGDTLYIVDVFKGSTGLAQDGSQQDWSPASSLELFNEATTTLASARAVVNLPLSAVLWTQGEQDAVDSAKASAYQTNLSNLFANIRTTWGDVGTNIEFARLNSGQTGLTYLSTVRGGQDGVASTDTNAFETNTDSFPLQSDHLHYTGVGQYDLGHAYYQAYEFNNRSVNGGSSNDSINGASGNDSIFGNGGNDLLTGGAGSDTLQGNAGADTVQGNAGSDYVYGGQGNDFLYGGQGDDVLFGNLGSDFLSGDKGNDTLSGGPDADTFNYQTTMGADVVTDFSTSEGDVVRLPTGTSYSLSYTATDTLLSLGGGDVMTLQNTHLTGSSWIVFV